MGRIDIEELAARVRIEGISSEEDCLALLDELRAARAVVDVARKIVDGAPVEYLKARPQWEITLENIINDYDKLINDGGE